MDAFTGEIRLFPYNFAPENWAYCDGSSLSIQQYPGLFSIIGILYGGNGVNSFQIPNLNGRVAMGAGAGPGLTVRPLASKEGADEVTLTTNNLAPHSHQVYAKPGNEASAALDQPAPGVYLAQPRNVRLYTTTAVAPGGSTLAPNTLSATGSPTALTSTRNTMQPFLTIAYFICLNGEYPVKP